MGCITTADRQKFVLATDMALCHRKFADRKKQNKGMKVWRQQKRNFFSIFARIKEKYKRDVKNIPWELLIASKSGI
jgi:hypothetical protein